jgi:arylamine N-acetyltransferase
MRDRYLRLLGIEEHPTGLEGLRLLVRRHLRAVPFENVSKLLLYDREGAGRAATLAEFLDGIEHQDLGGTCYSNNPFFADLLRGLGYDADLLGADMSKPDVHTCIRVGLDSLAYHVDVGFASPFREPIRLDRLPARIDEGGNHFILDRDSAEGAFCMRMFIREECRVTYLAHDPPRTREHFAPAIGMSFAPSSTFMQHLRISRIFEDYSLDLWDRELLRHDAGGTSIRRLATMTELKAAVAEDLGPPRCPVESAIGVLERLTGKSFFEVAGTARAD